MICRDVQSELTAYLQDELPEEYHREVEAHLRRCVTCRDEAEALVRALRAVRSLPAVEPSAEERRCLVERVLRIAHVRRTRREKHRRRRLSPVGRALAFGRGGFAARIGVSPVYLLASAATLALVIGGILLSGSWVEPSAPSSPKTLGGGNGLRAEVPYTVEMQAQAHKERWNRRHSRYARELTDGAVDLFDVGDVGSGNWVRVVGFAAGARSKERCLIVFTERDWLRLQARSVIAEDYTVAMVAGRKAEKVRLRGTEMPVPEGMKRYLAGEDRLAVVRLEGRTEIWGSRTWDDYIRRIHVSLEETVARTFAAGGPLCRAGLPVRSRRARRWDA